MIRATAVRRRGDGYVFTCIHQLDHGIALTGRRRVRALPGWTRIHAQHRRQGVQGGDEHSPRPHAGRVASALGARRSALLAPLGSLQQRNEDSMAKDTAQLLAWLQPSEILFDAELRDRPHALELVAET